VEENANRVHFFIASISVIHPQILIFSVFKIASLSPCWVQIRFSCHCSFAYLRLPSIFARTEETFESVNDLVLSKQDKPQTHRTVREISRETGIHRSSVSQIICKDLHLKCFKRRSAQELTDANCAARMKRAKLLLQKFPQYATDFVFFTDKKVFFVLHLTIGRTKSVADCGNFWRRRLAFSSVRALCGLPCLAACSLCLCHATFWTAY